MVRRHSIEGSIAFEIKFYFSQPGENRIVHPGYRCVSISVSKLILEPDNAYFSMALGRGFTTDYFQLSELRNGIEDGLSG